MSKKVVIGNEIFTDVKDDQIWLDDENVNQTRKSILQNDFLKEN